MQSTDTGKMCIDQAAPVPETNMPGHIEDADINATIANSMDMQMDSQSPPRCHTPPCECQHDEHGHPIAKTDMNLGDEVEAEDIEQAGDIEKDEAIEAIEAVESIEEVLDDDEAPVADDDVATVPDIANTPIPHHLRGCCVPAFKRHKSANA